MNLLSSRVILHLACTMLAGCALLSTTGCNDWSNYEKVSYEVQLFVDTSASAVHWTKSDNFWFDNLANLATVLTTTDKLHLYITGNKIIEVSDVIDKPNADVIKKHKSELIPEQPFPGRGTCVKDMLQQAEKNLAFTATEKPILAFVIDEDEGASGCPQVSDEQWTQWFERVTQKAKVLLLPLNPDNRFATKLSNLTGQAHSSVAICRRIDEPNCHTGKFKQWREIRAWKI